MNILRIVNRVRLIATAAASVVVLVSCAVSQPSQPAQPRNAATAVANSEPTMPPPAPVLPTAVPTPQPQPQPQITRVLTTSDYTIDRFAYVDPVLGLTVCQVYHGNTATPTRSIACEPYIQLTTSSIDSQRRVGGIEP